ncbi:MAG: hypothetical protein M3237_07010 [Actinomycetota bacterium]|nr:hypothetical protein [Actinomycetota bacterium]
MPTEASWTERNPHLRAVTDVGHLVRFRAAAVRRRSTFRWGAGLLLVVTVAVAVVPAYVPGAGGSGKAFDVLLLLPTALAAFLAVGVVSAAASGGGRELLDRDASSVHPISPTTDHLGALLLAPLNIAWLLQTWTLLGGTAYALGNEVTLMSAQVVLLLWIATATATSQAVAWGLEGARRVPHGVVGIRALVVALLGAALGLQISGHLLSLFDRFPTKEVVVGMVIGFNERWLLTVLALAGLLLAAVVVGAMPAHLAAHRIPRDELRVEAGTFAARRPPFSDLTALIRTDRGSVWRAVSMRRGLAVLAVGPGLVALLGDLPWGSMTILPGLVASGGALLFGVNAWCLDGRGALWRESLPVLPGTVFTARAYVLAEFLLAASLATVALAAVRAGVPDVSEMVALVCTLVVVTVQVVAAALRWSAQHPFAVDLRSARATPAPPLSMVAYSTRLAISTTLTGVVFSVLSGLDEWRISVLIAVPFVCWSSARLARTYRLWLTPVERARIITTVAV